MNSSINSNYDLRHNYNEVKVKAVSKLLNCEFKLHNIVRVIKKRKDQYLCQLNIENNINYKWFPEEELTKTQKNLLINPKLYNFKINKFRFDFKHLLMKNLVKAQTNNIKFSVEINEEVFNKLFTNIQIIITNNENSKYNLNIYEKEFKEIFKFDLKSTSIIDCNKQYIVPIYPLQLKKPRFTVRKNNSFKFIHENQEILNLTEKINFKVSINCGNFS
jgi:hypothetical protein